MRGAPAKLPTHCALCLCATATPPPLLPPRNGWDDFPGLFGAPVSDRRTGSAAVAAATHENRRKEDWKNRLIGTAKKIRDLNRSMHRARALDILLQKDGRLHLQYNSSAALLQACCTKRIDQMLKME